MTLFDLKEAAMKGRKLRRKCWSESEFICDYKNIMDIHRKQDKVISANAIFADDWEVVPEYVGWKEALQALKDGKEIIAAFGAARWRVKLEGIKILIHTTKGLEVSCLYNKIPVEWLFQDDFEVVDA